MSTGLGARLRAARRSAPTEDLTRRVRHRLADAPGGATPAGVIDAIRSDPTHATLGSETLLQLGSSLYEEIVGAGPLGHLLVDPTVTDVVVNGPAEVWVDRGAGMVPVPIAFPDAEAVARLARRLAAAGGRRLDDASPYVDVRLPDGTRLHAVLAPVAVRGPYLSLRTFRPRALTFDELVGAGTLDTEAVTVLTAVVAARLAYLVTGGTGAGKTTLLSSLLGLVPPAERIVIVEDATELHPDHPHVVALQSRPSNVEGAGAVGLRDLVRQALRMRPDRLVIGECRGAEIVDMLAALNTGHEGGAATLHANAAADVPARLEALGLIGGIPRPALHAQMAAGLQVVLHLIRRDGVRRLEEVCVLLPAGSEQLVRAVPAWRRGKGAGPAAGALARLFHVRGAEVPPVLDGHA